MPELQDHEAGTFCWADLATTDPAAAKAFYGALMGWAASDSPDPSMPYTQFQAAGRNVAGMGPLPAGLAAAGVPPHWTVYVATADADATVAKALELGGTVLAGPFDVGPFGRMAALRDPQGCAFSVWQAREHRGFGLTGDAGSPCWFELMTPDAVAAKTFYCALFGWGVKESGFPGMEYHEWLHGGRTIGGLMPMTGPEWSGVPPHWMLYLHAADCDAAAARLKELGGSVCVPPSDIPKVGRFSVVADPQGATFSLFQPAGPAC